MARDCDCFWIMVEELGAVRAIETHHSICGHQDKEAGELGVRDVGAAPMTSELDRGGRSSIAAPPRTAADRARRIVTEQ